jgi:hypothetical protein
MLSFLATPEEAMATARRGFLKSLAVAPLVPALAPQPTPPPASPSGREAVAEALAEVVKREFGKNLDAAELEAVKKELTSGLERAERLRQAARLRNADEPISRFEARPPGTPARGGRR